MWHYHISYLRHYIPQTNDGRLPASATGSLPSLFITADTLKNLMSPLHCIVTKNNKYVLVDLEI